MNVLIPSTSENVIVIQTSCEWSEKIISAALSRLLFSFNALTRNRMHAYMHINYPNMYYIYHYLRIAYSIHKPLEISYDYILSFRESNALALIP